MVVGGGGETARPAVEHQGWTSSADPMTSIDMNFDTKEQAIAFAQKKGGPEKSA
jgi:hypothetical protein